MNSENSLAVTDRAPVSIDHVVNQIATIQQAMKRVMHSGTHYGTVPGCGEKPALFKAGAEKLCMLFRLIPSFVWEEKKYDGGHREIIVTCTLTHVDGTIAGQGLGSCSTLESKYRYRNAGRKCPKCGKEAIKNSKEEYGGGYFCFGKAGGCGTKFNKGDKSIESQVLGKVENPDLADQYNTVLKMAKKRAHVDATITATAASDIFIQDIDEKVDVEYVDNSEQMPDETPPIPVTKDAKGRDEFYYDLSLILDDDMRAKATKFCAEHKLEHISEFIYKSPIESKKLASAKIAKPEPVAEVVA